jgi:hypothetical protein
VLTVKWLTTEQPTCLHELLQMYKPAEVLRHTDRSIAYKQLLHAPPAAFVRSVSSSLEWSTEETVLKKLKFCLINVNLKLDCSVDHSVANARWPAPAICQFIVIDIWRMTSCETVKLSFTQLEP